MVENWRNDPNGKYQTSIGTVQFERKVTNVKGLIVKTLQKSTKIVKCETLGESQIQS